MLMLMHADKCNGSYKEGQQLWDKHSSWIFYIGVTQSLACGMAVLQNSWEWRWLQWQIRDTLMFTFNDVLDEQPDLWLYYVGGMRRSPDGCLPGGLISLETSAPLCTRDGGEVLWCDPPPLGPLSTWGWGRAAGSEGAMEAERVQRWSKGRSFTGAQSNAVKLDQAA